MPVHIEPVGGVSGDMFVAAFVDAEPELAPLLSEALARLGTPGGLRLEIEPTRNHQIDGHRFAVRAPSLGHNHYADIVRLIEASGLDAPVKARALDVFRLLGRAESKVHGVPLEAVTFHEVGNWDSIVDIVLAATLIERHGDDDWTIGSLPLGEGFVQCDHGRIPVPAPATVELLRDLPVHRDGIEGERVTPTGAAILRHISPRARTALPTMRLERCGVGFGTRTFEGISNVLRLFFLSELESRADHDEVTAIRFDVDDQTPEDLAIGLDRIRATDGVLDVVQYPVYGKKGRLASRVEILVRPCEAERVIGQCFIETSTIGLRYGTETRRILPREHVRLDVEGGVRRAKRVTRPDGSRTGKLEADDLAGQDKGFSARRRQGSAVADVLSAPPSRSGHRDDD